MIERYLRMFAKFLEDSAKCPPALVYVRRVHSQKDTFFEPKTDAELT